MVDIADNEEIQRRPWRFNYYLAWGKKSSILPPGKDEEVLTPELKKLANSECFRAPAVRKVLRKLLRQQQENSGNVLMMLPDVKVCDDAGHLERPGKKLLRHWDLDELFAESDVVSLHCPLTPSTKDMVNKSRLEIMKSNAILINTGRGPLVNEQDLADALNEGRIAAAGLDVLSVEPSDSNNPLLCAKNCFITPHIAWATKEARTRLMDIAVNNLKSYIQGTIINNVAV